MLTLQKIHNHVKRLSETYIPKAKQRRFLSGVQTLSFQEFSSLNRAGRQLSPNRLTGETRIRRIKTATPKGAAKATHLVASKKLLGLLGIILNFTTFLKLMSA